jgi:hypothetical protein
MVVVKKLITSLIVVVVLVLIFLVSYQGFDTGRRQEKTPGEELLPPGTVRAPDGSLFQEPPTGPPVSPPLN